MKSSTDGSGALQRVLAWFVLSAILAAAIGMGGDLPAVWIPMTGAVLLAAAVQIIRDLSDPSAGRMFRRLLPALACYALALTWAGLQSVPVTPGGWAHPSWAQSVEALVRTISASPDDSALGLLRLLSYGGAFWIAARTASNTVRVSQMIDVIAIFGGVLAATGLLMWATGVNPFAMGDVQSSVLGASFGTGEAYVLYAALGCMTCLTAVAMRLPDPTAEGLARSVIRREFNETVTRTAWVFSLGACAAAAAMIATGSTIGTVSGLIGVSVVLLVLVGRHLGARSAFFALVILLSVASSLVMLMAGLADQAGPSAELRFEVYAQIIEDIQNRPWLGHGLAAFPLGFDFQVDEGALAQDWQAVRSLYLESAWELGLPAAVLLTLAPLVVLVQIALGLARRKRMRPVLILALGVGLAGGVQAAASAGLHMPATAGVFAMILGLAWGVSGRQKARRSGAADG